eukprot:4455106-Karenia_brevis.AAC.1
MELEDVSCQLKALTHQISKEVVPEVHYQLTGAQVQALRMAAQHLPPNIGSQVTLGLDALAPMLEAQ